MLIDAFTDGWLDEMNSRARSLAEHHVLYLLIDGAFVPGLHRCIAPDRKALVFESLPGCSDDARDVSPFLTPMIADDAALERTLRRCSGWPMISLIESPETLEQLAARLAAWCVVEVDGQRFNFRFADTRRLPAIYQALDATQRSQFVGPAVAWSYIARNGTWCRLDIEGEYREPASDPQLTEQQFVAIDDDSRADEVLATLALRGYLVGHSPSNAHIRTVAAITAASTAQLQDREIGDWCEWLWKHHGEHRSQDVDSVLAEYLTTRTSS